MKLNRSKNAVRNAGYGFLSKITAIVLPFLVRTVFIHTLGAEYLGLNSLFSSILSVLNLTELGFSSAIVYHLYAPIARDDQKTINALLQYYKTVYRIIGMIILLVGCSLIPFLPRLIKGAAPEGINITVIYLVYLFNTAASYFLYAYYSSLISSFQREDLISKSGMIASFVMYGLQILCLLTVKEYYAYLAIMPVFTIVNNLRIYFVAKKEFPEYRPEGKIDQELRRDIRVKVSGLMISKVCGVSRNAFDSIFISLFLGLVATAKYNNYYYILNSIVSIMSVLTTAITAGVGNSVALDNVETNYRNLKKMNFIYMWLSGWFAICLLCLYQPFMKLWVGEELMFSWGTVLLICLYFYVLKMGDVRAVYVQTKGLWWENRSRALYEAIANIVLNYVLGKYFGVNGIILATLLSLFFINFLYGSQIVFKYYFGISRAKEYYLSHLKYGVATFLGAAITIWVCSQVHLEGIAGLFIKAVICTFMPNLFYWLVYQKTKDYQETIPWLLEKITVLKHRK